MPSIPVQIIVAAAPGLSPNGRGHHEPVTLDCCDVSRPFDGLKLGSAQTQEDEPEGMMTANNGNGNAPDSLAATIERGIATILDPILSLQYYAAYPLRVLAGLDVHAVHRARAEQLAREYVDRVQPALADQNLAAVKELRAEYTQKILYGGFTQAPPEKSQWEIWHFRAADLDWHRDFNTLINCLQPGEKITGMDREKATTSIGRTITLRELWLSRKPANDATPDHIWLEQRRLV